MQQHDKCCHKQWGGNYWEEKWALLESEVNYRVSVKMAADKRLA